MIKIGRAALMGAAMLAGSLAMAGNLASYSGVVGEKTGWRCVGSEAGKVVYIPFEGYYESKGGRIESPRFNLNADVGKNNFFRLTFSAKCPVDGYWWVDFFDAKGQLLPDVNSRLYASADWQKYDVVVPAHPDAVEGQIAFVTRKGAQAKDVAIRRIDVKEAAAWCDQFAATLPKLDAPNTADAWAKLPRARQKIASGETLRIVFLGDSIVNDTWCGNAVAQIQNALPKADLRCYLSVRGSTGCWYYHEAEHFEEYVARYKPDLVLIGGLSNQGRPKHTLQEAEAYMAETIDRCLKLGAEVVVTTPPPSYEWRETAEAKPFDKTLTEEGKCWLFEQAYERRAAAKHNVTVWDMTTAPAEAMCRSGKPLRWFKRDDAHSDDRGKQLIACTLAAYFRAAVPQATTIRSVSCVPKGVERHQQKMAAIAAEPPKVVFLGDSITHFWESPGRGKATWDKFFAKGPMKALCLGTSADRTEHLLWRIANGEFDGYEAKCIVLMIGTNNSGHFSRDKEPPINTILGIRAVLKALRAKQPKAAIVLHPIFPRGAFPNDATRIRNNIVNKEIVKFADGQTIFWCDFNEQFLTSEGELLHEFFPDYLHPDGYGYEVWASAVKPYIAYALSDGALPAPGNRYTSRPRRDQFRGKDDCVSAYPVSGIWNLDGWWLDRLLAKQNEIAANEGGTFDLVMLGDSITHNWENGEAHAAYRQTHKVLNLGFGGDRTEHLLWRLENGELDGYKARQFMLMIGTNSTASHQRKEDVARGIKATIDLVLSRHPEAEQLLLLPIFPRGASATDKVRLVNEEVNKIIRGYADGQKVVWCDFNAQFLDAQGDTKALMPDRLHPNAAGYAIWWKNIEKLLK